MAPLIWNSYVEPTEDAIGVLAPGVGHSRGCDRIFEYQIPPDDPRDKLAHCRVGVGVGTACDRNHRRKLRVTETGKGAADASDNEGKYNRWTRAIGNGRSGAHEKTCADDPANSQRN